MNRAVTPENPIRIYLLGLGVPEGAHEDLDATCGGEITGTV